MFQPTADEIADTGEDIPIGARGVRVCITAMAAAAGTALGTGAALCLWRFRGHHGLRTHSRHYVMRHR